MPGTRKLMRNLIRHAGAASFLAEIQNREDGVALSQIRVEAGEETVSGTGSIRWSDGAYRVEWNLDPAECEQFVSSLKSGWGKPQTFTESDRWRVQAVTREELNLEFWVFPPRTWTFLVGQPHCIKLRASHLKVVKPPRDQEGERALIARLADLGINWEPGEVEEEHSGKVLHHAVFRGVRSPLRLQRFTSTTVKNDFLGGFNEEIRDTWISEKEGMSFALIQREDELHAYLKFSDAALDASGQDEVFSAFLDAIGFTHGCRPWPMLREVTQGIRNRKCEIGSLEPLRKGAAAPLTETLFVNDSDSESMLLVAFDFFVAKGQLQDQVRRLHGLLCEAHEGSLIRHSDILALCTLFEGTVNSVFDHLSLKKGVNSSEAAVAFREAKDAAIAWIESKMTLEEVGSEPSWSRMMGIIRAASFIRPEEKLQAISDHYGFPWTNDVEEISAMWKKQRNPIAHGSGKDESEDGMRAMFASWSRLTGFINRLILAEMGYSGCLSYSPMEEGLVLKRIVPNSRE